MYHRNIVEKFLAIQKLKGSMEIDIEGPKVNGYGHFSVPINRINHFECHRIQLKLRQI